MTPRLGCVVLTQGHRAAELRRALDSLVAQRGVALDVAVVGNAWQPSGLPHGVHAVGLPRNLGIPAGRNAGVAHVAGELLFFLDEDASLAAPDALARVVREFDADPAVGALQLRVAARDGGRPLREWVPRLRAGDPSRSSDVTALWEGAVAIRREAFERVGGWPSEFLFVHEGVDLAWRVLDAGYRVRYSGDIVAVHPPPSPGAAPARHGYSLYFGARNRVWIARRYLPLPLGALYVGTFAARTLPRLRSIHDLRLTARGYRDGVRRPCGERRRLRPRTLWRMTRVGRPPVI
jgi:GT2 family glycosyltransferase